MSEPFIVAEGVSRWFGPVAGVADVSLSLGAGAHALVGPNGAGKTTVLRLIAGTLRPSRGVIRLFGAAPWRNAKALARLGFASGDAFDDEPLSARAVIDGFARLSGIRASDAIAAVDRALDAVGLDPADARPVRKRPTGERRRVAVASALAHDPEIVVLDGPFEGTDDASEVAIARVLSDAAGGGRCVVFSCDRLSAATAVTDEIALLVDGRLLGAGDVADLARGVGLAPTASLAAVYDRLVLGFDPSATSA